MSKTYEEKLKETFKDKPNYRRFSLLVSMGHDYDFIKKLYSDELKTFDDLEFGAHGNKYLIGAKQAIIEFDNGHFVSVVGGVDQGLYGDGISTFEVGFPLPDDSIDVEGWLSPKEVSELMFIIQSKEPYE
jgi:hypothetical protein